MPPEGSQPARRAAGTGDGGASWRMKALKRAQAQAQSEVGESLSVMVILLFVMVVLLLTHYYFH